MVRPATYRMNEQTAVNNYFQHEAGKLSDNEVVTRALAEFDGLVNVLREAGIGVIVFQDTDARDTPDAVFPNNWVSFHEDGTAILYPMFAENRRKERSEDVIRLVEDQGFHIENIMDYTSAEDSGIFLEGTGSVELDRLNERAYCALSERSDESLFMEFCEDQGYWPVPFHAFQSVEDKRLPIYHTNVMMSVGSRLAMICLDCIDDPSERKNVRSHLLDSGKEILSLSEEQIAHFAGNTLELQNQKGEAFFVMSTNAYQTLTSKQRNRIEKDARILHSPLDVIELLGGGSARCMLAEVFLPRTGTS
jgi:hypothetical protein